MSREYRETTQTQTFIGVAKVTCDRCGDSARVVGATPKLAWGGFSALEQGSADAIELDLCRSCTEEIIEFIKQHPRAVIRRQSDDIQAMGQAEREART
jgi:hypothetical protein